MRDSNFIKSDEKFIPHFRRTELFTSGGGKPEGKVGEQYFHVRDVHPISRWSPPTLRAGVSEYDVTRKKGVIKTPA